jgi:L-rhamnose mutarotase
MEITQAPSQAARKVAFRMFLRPGSEAEYRRRHDDIWPELSALLQHSGLSDYSIYLEHGSGTLFAVQLQSADFDPESLQNHPVMRKWWRHMAPLMRTHEDGSPIVEPLPCVFHLG